MNGDFLPSSRSYNLTTSDMEQIALKAFKLTMDIIKNNQTNNRNYEQIYRSSLNGAKLEYGVSKMFIDSELNPNEFDHTNEYSYFWDIKIGDKLIEIKPITEDSVWLNFNLKSHYNENIHGVYSFYDTFLKNSDKLDYIFIVFENNNSIHLRYIIDAKSFHKYVRQSKRAKNGSTHYYDIRNGKQDNKVIQLK